MKTRSNKKKLAARILQKTLQHCSKEKLFVNSLEKTQKNLVLFFNGRKDNFIDFIKQIWQFRDFYSWSNSLFQSLGPSDETEYFI